MNVESLDSGIKTQNANISNSIKLYFLFYMTYW